MRTDYDILYEAMDLLRQKLDITEVERFIMLINSQGFNYTKWRENLWNKDETVESLSSKAQDFFEKQ